MPRLCAIPPNVGEKEDGRGEGPRDDQDDRGSSEEDNGDDDHREDAICDSLRQQEFMIAGSSSMKFKGKTSRATATPIACAATTTS